jgi:phosphate transport system permease protein
MLRWMCLVISLFLLSLLLLPMARAVPFMSGGLDLGVLSFSWNPSSGEYGFLLSLFGSLMLVALSLPPAVALAWGVTYQLVKTPAHRLKGVVLSVLQAANSIPSVVIGIWGIDQLVPFIRSVKGTGYSVLTCTVALVVLSLPTTVLLLKQSFEEYLVVYNGLERSLGFRWWDSTRYFLRTAREQLRQVWLYTFCRLFGETTVVLMLSGNSQILPDGMFKGFRTLTSSIALEMAYATGRHEHALYALATLSIFCLAVVATVGRRPRTRLSHP